MRTTTTRGFTLIELSIVLVIIGLLVGGVLMGRDLVHAAEIRKTVKQVEQFDSAVNTFRNKYNCLPGDCQKAYAFGFTNYFALAGGTHAIITVGGGFNGNGDGMIGNGSDSAASYKEYLGAFWQLSTTGLVKDVIAPPDFLGPNYSFVKAPIGPGQQGMPVVWSVMWMAASAFDPGNQFFSESHSPDHHYYWLTADWWAIAPTAILPVDAYAIDVKLDDGLPRSGKVLASGSDAQECNVRGPLSDPYGASGCSWAGTPDEGPAGADSNFCVTGPLPTPETYNVQNVSGYSDLWVSGVGALCTLTVKTNF